MDIICTPSDEHKQRTIPSFWRCPYNTYTINNADNIDISCNEELACDWSVYNINNVTNGTSFSCDKGCANITININNTDNLDIVCEFNNDGKFS